MKSIGKSRWPAKVELVDLQNVELLDEEGKGNEPLRARSLDDRGGAQQHDSGDSEENVPLIRQVSAPGC